MLKHPTAPTPARTRTQKAQDWMIVAVAQGQVGSARICRYKQYLLAEINPEEAEMKPEEVDILCGEWDIQDTRHDSNKHVCTRFLFDAILKYKKELGAC